MSAALHRPKVGFAGVGWIGLNRLRAIAETGSAEIMGVVDANPQSAQTAVAAVCNAAPRAHVLSDFGELIASDLDGIVIATPSGLHAEQAMAALENGIAVFCQKPLARDASEAAEVIAAARRRDRLLGVDFCYRTVAGVPEMVELARGGHLGDIFAADLLFHNAYGPDKPWFYDRRLSGGGCVMDLGIHLLDLALLVLDYPQVESLTSRLHSQGRQLEKPVSELEDHAFAEFQLSSGTSVRLACSWRLSAGQDAVIDAAFYGTRGAIRLRNLEGSFYNFIVEHYTGTRRRTLASGDAHWGGRAANAWVRALADGHGFDSQASHLYDLSRLIDQIYGRDAAGY